jgi:signal transduction histidine kinase
VRPEATRSGIQVSFTPSGLELPADERALTQILVNLLGNAIKFNRPGGRVELRAEQLQETLRITVEDSGIGMSAEESAAASQVLSRTNAYHARPQGGAGLGLAICRRLIERHNGTLEIESRLGMGTTVTVILPGADRSPAGALPLTERCAG